MRQKFVFVSNRKHCFIEPNSTIFSVTDKTVDTPQKAFNDLLSGNKDKAIKRKSPGLKKNDIIEIFIFAKEGLTEAVHKKLHETARKHGADIDRILEQVQRRDDVEDNLEEFANQVCKSTDDVDSMLLDLYEVINQCYTDFGMEKVPPDIKKEINDLRIDGDRAVANAIFLWWDYDNPNDVSELVDEIHFRRFDGFWMICTEKEWKSGRSNKGK